MKILKRLFLIVFSLVIAFIISIEFYYQYKINQLEPRKLLSHNSYPLVSHEILWVFSGEKGNIALDQFSATELACDFIRLLTSDSSRKDSSILFPKGFGIVSNAAKNQLLNSSHKSQGSHHFKNIVLSIWVSKHYKEDETFNYILDTKWFGNNIYGLSEASKFYYNKNVNKLNTSEIISLFVISYSPRIFDPYISQDKHIRKAKKIVNKLKKNWPIKYKNYFYSFPSFLKRDNK